MAQNGVSRLPVAKKVIPRSALSLTGEEAHREEISKESKEMVETLLSQLVAFKAISNASVSAKQLQWEHQYKDTLVSICSEAVTRRVLASINLAQKEDEITCLRLEKESVRQECLRDLAKKDLLVARKDAEIARLRGATKSQFSPRALPPAKMRKNLYSDSMTTVENEPPYQNLPPAFHPSESEDAEFKSSFMVRDLTRQPHDATRPHEKKSSRIMTVDPLATGLPIDSTSAECKVSSSSRASRSSAQNVDSYEISNKDPTPTAVQSSASRARVCVGSQNVKEGEHKTPLTKRDLAQAVGNDKDLNDILASIDSRASDDYSVSNSIETSFTQAERDMHLNSVLASIDSIVDELG